MIEFGEIRLEHLIEIRLFANLAGKILPTNMRFAMPRPAKKLPAADAVNAQLAQNGENIGYPKPIPRPFLKWVGGKRSIMPEIVKRIPRTFQNYYEPFLGGGALFFALRPETANISDVNRHLIFAFQAVRDDVERLIFLLRGHAARHGPQHFSEARETIGTEKDPTNVAALLIYLNKTCYNGLYRVNRKGAFNAPMGDYKNPAIVDPENLLAASKALKHVVIGLQNFAETRVEARSFYYLDPPYHRVYNGYHSDRFEDSDHKRLADFCRELDHAGAYFMVSNSDTDFVRALYKGFNIEQVMAARMVSCKAHQRGRENELLIRNYQ